MECLCCASAAEPEQAPEYQLTFNGTRVSQAELAEICALIDSGVRVTAINY